MSDTPRTDVLSDHLEKNAIQNGKHGLGGYAYACLDFARQLERELSARPEVGEMLRGLAEARKDCIQMGPGTNWSVPSTFVMWADELLHKLDMNWGK